MYFLKYLFWTMHWGVGFEIYYLFNNMFFAYTQNIHWNIWLIVFNLKTIQVCYMIYFTSAMVANAIQSNIIWYLVLFFVHVKYNCLYTHDIGYVHSLWQCLKKRNKKYKINLSISSVRPLKLEVDDLRGLLKFSEEDILA